MERKINSRTGECVNCNGVKKKADFGRKSVGGNIVLVCRSCGYYNSPSIFQKYEKIRAKKLVFGENYIKKGKVY